MPTLRGFARLIAGLALAAAGAARADFASSASLDWEDVDVEVEVAGIAATFEMSRVGATLVETYHPRIRGALRAGYLTVTSEDEPNLAGVEPDGGFIGGNLAVDLWRDERFALTALAEYLYVYTSDGEATTQKVALRWNEARAQLGASFRLGAFELVAAAYTLRFDGEEILTGAVDATLDFEASESSGTLGGIDLWVDETGRIGVRAESGAREGLMFVFARDF